MPSDSNFPFCELLLHGNGTDGSTYVIDSSKNGEKAQANSNSMLVSTTQSKFNGSSLYCNGSSNLLMSVPNMVAKGAFCIEMWVYPLAAGGSVNKGIFGLQNEVNFCFLRENTTNRLAFQYIRNGVASTLTSSTTGLTTGVWQHLAVTWDGATIRIYKDGTSVASVAAASASSLISLCRGGANGFALGYDHSSNQINAYFAEVGIYSGVAKYAGASYSVPTAPLGDYYYQVTGNITESSPITDWEVRAYDAVTGRQMGWGFSTGTTYTCNVDSQVACYVMLTPRIDHRLGASTEIVFQGQILMGTNWDSGPNPHLWKVTSTPSGLGVASTTPNPPEALVAPSNLTDANGNVFTYIGRLEQPITQGPLLPV